MLANPILSLLFGAGQSADIAASALSVLALGSLFLCVSSLVSTILQSLGKANIPVYNMLIGAVIKLAANFILVAIPGVELIGAAVGTVLCYAVISILNLIYLAKFIDFKPNIIKTYLRPLIATAIMGVVVFVIYRFASGVLGSISALGASIVLGALSYGIVILLIGGIDRNDILLLPKGEKIANLLRLK